MEERVKFIELAKCFSVLAKFALIIFMVFVLNQHNSLGYSYSGSFSLVALFIAN